MIIFGYCATPGYTDLVYRDSSRRIGGYCETTHRLWREKGCILCRKAEKSGDSKFCYTCNISTKYAGPTLVPVPEENETYNDIAAQFRKSWRHPTACPKIREIYKIVASANIVERYNVYRNVVEGRYDFSSQGLTSGNQLRRWHGTNRQCNIGDNGRTSLCYSSQCSLCCIIRSSFDISHAKKKTGWGRFGCGIYTSSTPSKSSDYSTNLTTSTRKALLLAHVTAGKAVKYTTDRPSLTQPPLGFDSVIGEPSSTGSLNYDELVVYTNDAICPAYLVMYDR